MSSFTVDSSQRAGGGALVGRAHELAVVRGHLGAATPVVVVGEAGIGKTALLREAGRLAGRRVYEGGAFATLSWMDHLPLRRAIGRPVSEGDPTRVAADVIRVVGAGVLVLDDLQWSDAATLDVIDAVGGEIAILAGVRSNDPGAGSVRDRLRAAGFEEVVLPPLAADDAAEVIRTLRPTLPPGAVKKVVARAGGNPLMLYELSTTGEPTTSLRLALAARLRNVDAPALHAFHLLCLAGRPVARRVVGEAPARSLLANDLAVEDAAGLAVRHALLAEIAVAQLAEGERRGIHAALARALSDDGEVARHHVLAGEDALGLAAALRAADAASRPGVRATHLALAASCAAGPDADALRLRAARALSVANDFGGLDTTLALLDSPDPQLRGWAALLRARSAYSAGVSNRLRPLIDEGLAAVRGTNSEVEVLLRVEECRIPGMVEGDHDRAVRMATEALDLAISAGIDQARAHYMLGTLLVLGLRAGGRAHLEAAVAQARRSDDLQTEFLSVGNLASTLWTDGDLAGARQLAIEATARAEEFGLDLWSTRLRCLRINLEWFTGDYETAMAEIERLADARVIGRDAEDVVVGRAICLMDTGQIDAAAEVLRTALAGHSEDDVGIGQLYVHLAEAAWLGGQPAQALEHLQHAYGRLGSLMDEPFLAIVRGWAALDLGQEPGPAVTQVDAKISEAIPAETRGIALLHLADAAGAVVQFREAAELWAPYHLRGEVRCRWALGEALRRAGDVAGAVAVLAEVERLAESRGMAPMLGRIRRSLRSCGVRRTAPRSSAGNGITTRERQVLELVANGLTNDEIAARLGLAKRTVETQLASAVAKLGASGRAHAALLAAQRP